MQEPVLAEPLGSLGKGFCQSVWMMTSLIETRGQETEAELTATVYNAGEVGMQREQAEVCNFRWAFASALCLALSPSFLPLSLHLWVSVVIAMAPESWYCIDRSECSPLVV